jgi:hypothetical protein
MFVKLILLSIVFIAFAMVALGIKKLFNSNAIIEIQSCALEDGSLDGEGTCSRYQIKDFANCPEKRMITTTQKTI